MLLKELPLDSLAVDRRLTEPLQQQLYAHLRDLLLSGLLPAGFRLPSTRLLAQQLDVSRNTVSAAYERLASDGYISSRPGGRATVNAADPVRSVPRPAAPEIEQYDHTAIPEEIYRYWLKGVSPPDLALRPFTPDIRHFPFKIWRRLVANRFQLWGDEFFGYNHRAGYMPLRKVVADYLQANRGIRADWQRVIITNGAQGAIDLVSRLLLKPGEAVWMEDPGYCGARAAFAFAGANILPLRVDPTDGWHLDPVPRQPVRLIYVTPSCQQPLCTVMRPDARRRLAAIAAEKDAWIVEDDFDNEFRGGNGFVPAIQSLDPHDRTIYVGTFAKTLFPALRLGFLVVPETLLERVEQAIFATGHFAGLPLQAALCDFIEQGHFAHHLRRMRRLYTERREVFCDLSRRYLGDWLTPIEGTVGIQVPFLLDNGLSDTGYAQRANSRKLNVFPLSMQYSRHDPLNGFVLGYAGLNEQMMQSHLSSFRDVFLEAVG